MLHYGQGKWYPGETLPRWTFSLFWRRDGEPIWKDESLIAPEAGNAEVPVAAARDLLVGIAEHLGLEQDAVAEAYEDPGEWLLKEGKLPRMWTRRTRSWRPRGAAAHGAGVRARPYRAFRVRASRAAMERGRGPEMADGALDDAARPPVSRPGDSPVGYRLPLGTLPHVPPASFPYIVPTDPSVDRGALPARDEILPPEPAAGQQQIEASFTAAGAQQDRVEQRLTEIGGAVRTAMSVEPRERTIDGLHAAVEALEDYLELVPRPRRLRPNSA